MVELVEFLRVVEFSEFRDVEDLGFEISWFRNGAWGPGVSGALGHWKRLLYRLSS